MFILCVEQPLEGRFDTRVASSQIYARLQGHAEDQKSTAIKRDHHAKSTNSHHLSRLLSEMISI